jgi:hypothetical protein
MIIQTTNFMVTKLLTLKYSFFMKLIILLLPVLLCGFINIAVGQRNIQFIYIGSEPRTNEGVLITSAAFRGEYLNGEGRRLTKIYYTNQKALDTLKSYISSSNLVNLSDSFKRENGKIDTVKLIDAFKIIGADANPLYIRGKDCFALFTFSLNYLTKVGLGNTSVYMAMRDLSYQCHEGSFQRGIDLSRFHQLKDTFRIKDSPRILVKPNN